MENERWKAGVFMCSNMNSLGVRYLQSIFSSISLEFLFESVLACEINERISGVNLRIGQELEVLSFSLSLELKGKISLVHFAQNQGSSSLEAARDLKSVELKKMHFA